jgi:protocatechuate 3,4-dioxygenase beta subunit
MIHEESAMDRHEHNRRTRREVLQTALTVPATLVLAAYAGQTVRDGSPEVFAGEPGLPPTPACAGADDMTPSQMEGPYYKRRSPERMSLLESGMTGMPIVMTGYVLSRRCQPMARALLDFWQADAEGDYDNKGYRLRGHQFTDDAGRYRLETIVPGLYPGRTRHIHVKVQAPHRPILTTQLYFPGEPGNARDGLFNPTLQLTVHGAADGKVATFNFILDIA